LIFAAAMIVGCGPAFESNKYGVSEEVGGGGLGGTGPIINDPVLPPNANVVRNSNFEQGMNTWEDWGGSQLLTGNAAYGGGSSARVSGGDQGGMGQEVLYRVKTGATYNLRAQAKVAATSDEVYVGVRFFDLSNATIADLRTRVGSTTYQQLSVPVTVPKGASSAKVYLWKQSTINSFADVDEFSLVMSSPPVDPPKEATIANPNGYRPSGPSGNYNLVFDDSFNGSAVNSTYWNTGLWFTTTINNEQQAYRPENVRVNSGRLQLVSEQRSAQTTWGENMSYASGAITTRNKFAFTFGVVEARARVPRGAGLSSLFYLEPNGKRSPPEINVMTALGQTPGTVGFNYKFYDINGSVRQMSGTTSGSDFADAYHTYTVEWTPTTIRYYVDGVFRGSYTGDSILRDDAFIVLSQAVGGLAGGVSAGFPQTYEIDYVRVWQ